MEWLNCLRALSTNYMNCMYMDCIWTVLKLYMDCTWTILDYFCTVHVQVKIYAQWKTIWLLFFKKNPSYAPIFRNFLKFPFLLFFFKDCSPYFEFSLLLVQQYFLNIMYFVQIVLCYMWKHRQSFYLLHISFIFKRQSTTAQLTAQHSNHTMS